MANISLTLLVLKSQQVHPLRTFYNILGIELKEEQHGKGPIHYAFDMGMSDAGKLPNHPRFCRSLRAMQAQGILASAG